MIADLNAYILSYQGAEFSRGYVDCYKFVCRWLRLNNLSAPDETHPPYHTTREAVRLIRARGLKQFHEVFDYLAPVTMPERGDIAQIDGGGEGLGGICIYLGQGNVAAMTPKGLKVGEATIRRAWSIRDV